MHINQLCGNLEAAQSSIQKYHSFVEQLGWERDALQDALNTMQPQLHGMKAAAASQPHPQHEDELSKALRDLHATRENQAAHNARVEGLTQERGEARASLKCLRNEKETQTPPHVNSVLDSF